MQPSPVRMLLQRVLLDGEDGLPEMLKLVYGLEDDAISGNNNNNNNWSTCNTASTKTNHRGNTKSALARSKSPFDYLAHIRHLNLNIVHINPNNGSNRPSCYPHSPEKEDALEAHFATYDDIFMSRSTMRRMYEGAIIYWEATWSISNPILEQLESLTIPLADIMRYMGVVSRLGRLEHVRFNLDNCFREQYSTTDGHHYVVSDHVIKSMETMVPFLKEHQRLFKGQLKLVSVCDVGSWRMTSTLCPKEILWQVGRASPPLRCPRHLTPINWLQLAGHPLSTDLSHVLTLTSREHTIEWFDGPISAQEILAQCRSLKELSMLSVGKDAFKWAVQEKKALLDRLCRNGEGAKLFLQESTASPHFNSHQDTHRLVPLSSIRIEDFSRTEVIDDIAFAFSQTLESLTVRKYSNLDLLQPRFQIGRGWIDLPLLTKLCLQGYWDRLEIERDLLSHLPSLVCLEMIDSTTDYDCSDIVSCFAALLTSLEELELAGWPALTFHPGTLSSTRRIKTLLITTEPEEDDTRYIPPLEELELSFGGKVMETSAASDEGGATTAAGSLVNNRPQWSWDWQLPFLETLKLTSEFAFRFQFRMLQGCPSLRSLSLDIFTYGDDHERVLTAEDLFMTPLGKRAQAGAQGVAEAGAQGVAEAGAQGVAEAGAHGAAELGACRNRIVSGVTSLRLTGKWKIEDSILGPFFLGMFPELQEFVGCDGVGGYTLAGMMDVCRAGGQKWKKLIPNLPRPTHDDEMRKLGLYSFTEVPLDAEVMDMYVVLSGCSKSLKIVKSV
ncbi:hypothetical protein EC991_005052 [Linnemannia zychae]|nr:hypothetical protein EC991_005052 [Linnemannia zychae]